MTDLRFVFGEGRWPLGDRSHDLPGWPPSLLVSFVEVRKWIKVMHRYHFREWVLDSGAFSVHNSGRTIELDDFIECCKGLSDLDQPPCEIFALDVIGDWKGTKKNVEISWKRGVEAIPTYHIGEPWDVLKGFAADYPKIALGGVARIGRAKKERFYQECFARIWPKKVHGFGTMGEKLLMSYPFHTVDSTNWLGGAFGGVFKGFNPGKGVRLRNVPYQKQRDYSMEIRPMLELERKLKVRWKKVLAELEE